MNTKRRFLVGVLCILVTLVCIIGITACNKEQDNGECTHSWGEWSVKTDATCTEAGVKEQTCTKCGETKEGVIDALGHSGGTATCKAKAKCEKCNAEYGELSAHAWTDATCTAPKTCSVCSATEGEAVGHKGTGDCENKATCSVCGEKFGEALGHSWSDATCTSPKVCITCGKTDGEALGHKGGEATCQDKAVCTVCKLPYGELGEHDWEGGSCTTAGYCSICGERGDEPEGHKGGTATCSTPAICTVCGEEYGETIPHSWVDATCSSLETCSVCGESRGDIADHSWVDATCTAPRTCSVCSLTEGEALGHSYDDTVVDPTCLEKGYTLHVCSACGDEYRDNETDALGHDWSDPTCAHDRTCSRCDETEDALKHNYELSDSTDATCTSAQIDTYTCTGCGDFYTDDVGSELGHDISGVTPDENKVAGTTCDYVQVYECKTCGEDVEGDHVSHHDYIAKVTTEASCIAGGVKTLTCSDCGFELIQNIEKIPSAHAWDEGTLSGNIRTYTCKNGCNATKTTVDASSEESAKVNASDLAAAGGVDLKGASMTLDETTLGAVADKDLTLSAGTLSGTELTAAMNKLTPEQQEQLGDNPIYNFTMNDGTNNITSFNGGFITITIPYEVPDGDDVDSVAIWYISEGTPVCIEATYNNGYVTFQTNHFSYYSVTRLTPEERCQVYGHNLSVKIVEVGCTRDGYTLEVCIRCAKSEKKDIVPATGHTYDETHEVPATCTTAGSITYMCGCGYSYSKKLVATGHDWAVAETVESTCAAAGYIKNVCNSCGSEYTQTQPQLKHTYIDTTIAPTCEGNGYTLHTCSACGHEYKDNMIVAYGHRYESQWSWSKDYGTATLVSVCSRDESHVVETVATIATTRQNATCSSEGYVHYDAQTVFGGVVYRDNKTQTIEKLPHTFGDELSSNQSSHWYTCTKCSAKSETEAHKLGEAVITKEATCTEAGSSKQVCSVCSYEKVQTIPMLAHKYDGSGKCTVCGHLSGDCDHSMSNATVEIDLSQYGVCGGGVLILNTCACGEVCYVEDIDDVGGMCDLEYEYGETNTKDDGTMYATMYSMCSECGFRMDVYAEAKTENCFMTVTYDIAFSVNGKIIVEDVLYVEEDEYHDGEYGEYVIATTSCGDVVIRAEKCDTCGEFVYLSSEPNVKCDFEYEDYEVTDENGNLHEGERCVCTKCGLVIIFEEWYEEDGCYEIEYEAMYIEIDGERVFEYEEDYRSSNHDYDYEYSLKGETCADGVSVKRTCKVCGYISSYVSEGHETIPQEHYDMSEFGGCGGEIYTYACPCGLRSGLNYYNIDCNYQHMSAPSHEGDKGNDYYIEYIVCADCGLKITRESYTTSEGCYDYRHSTYNVTVGDKTVISNYECTPDYYDNHKYSYTFEMNGESCEDGFIAYGVCAECGYEEKREGYGHYTFCTGNYDLADLGACGGYVKVYSCPCGLEGNMDWSFECGECTEDWDEYTDEYGINHNVETNTCKKCGLTRVSDRYYEIDGCYEREYISWTISINGKTLVENFKDSYGYRENHKYETEINMYGESCEDGYYIKATCTVCGYSYEDEYHWHNTMETARYDFAEFGACNGELRIYSCACGEESHVNFYVDCKFDYDKVEEYTDGEGNLHYIEHGVCQTCGFEITVDRFSVIEGCYENRYAVYTGVMNGETVIDGVSGRTDRWSRHDYEYSFDMNGSSCEDGYTVYEYCKVCGLSSNYEQSGHYNFLVEEYDLSNYGACGGYIEVYRCACGEQDDVNFGLSCNYEYAYEEYEAGGIKHGVKIYTCSDCGLEVTLDSYNQKVGCRIVEYGDVTVRINGNEAFPTVSGMMGYSTQHNYEYRYDMYGSSCEDGYMRYVVCKDCGYSYESEYSWHNTDTLEKYDLSDYGACGGYIQIYACPCGKDAGFSYSLDCNYTGSYSYYEDENGIEHSVITYTCADCAIEMIRDTYLVKEGCREIEYAIYTVSVGGDVIVSEYKAVYSSWDDHDYSYSFVLYGKTCEDGYKVIATCRDCGNVSEKEEYYHHQYPMAYYDLSEYGICGGYVEIRRCACGEGESFDYNLECQYSVSTEYVTDDYGVEHTVRTFTCRDCELLMVQDSHSEKVGCELLHYRSYTLMSGDTVIIENYEYISSTSESHEFDYSFTLHGSSCEDGYTVTYTCRDCGASHDEEYTWHNTFLVEHYDLSEIGACGGQLEKYTCPCGYEQNVYYDTNCYLDYTNNDYVDEDGRHIHVEVGSCDKCGLRVQTSYYEERNAQTCTATQYSTILISANGGALEPVYENRSWTAHDYITEGRLMDGATSCNEGVIIYYSCRDCTYSYEDRTTWHTELVVETIDLSMYGSVCGGYAEHTSCVCGQRQSVDIYSDSFCEFDSGWCEMWIEDYINESQYTADGWNSFGYSTCLYTCAVTDPEQCAFRIRKAEYWAAVPGECRAERHVVWQFGYDPETGDCEYEIDYVTSSYTYHSYTTTEINNGTVKGTEAVCSRCGSSYTSKTYYDENGDRVKSETLAINTLNDGRRKRYESVNEYSQYNGSSYTSRVYERYIYADGTEYWKEETYVRSAYTASFGSNGYKTVETYKNSDGADRKSEYAYTVYKNTRFCIYDYYTNNASGEWYKYDYSYSFSGGCMRTTRYRNSDGEDTTTTKVAHESTYSETTKNPTCTQDGAYYVYCSICESTTYEGVHSPYGHDWYNISEDRYFCTRCGLENINGADGQIVLEDMTDAYGNGTNYVIGYWANNEVDFMYYVSIVLRATGEDIILDGVTITDSSTVRAKVFSKSEVEQLASALGYTADQYDVRFAFVPVGADGSFDYAVTLTEEENHTGNVTGSLSEKVYVGKGESYEYTITPATSGVWTFTSNTNMDTYAHLYDADGNEIAYNDDGSNNGNFLISYNLEAGQTYVLKARWYGNDRAGYMVIDIIAP